MIHSNIRTLSRILASAMRRYPHVQAARRRRRRRLHRYGHCHCHCHCRPLVVLLQPPASINRNPVFLSSAQSPMCSAKETESPRPRPCLSNKRPRTATNTTAPTTTPPPDNRQYQIGNNPEPRLYHSYPSFSSSSSSSPSSSSYSTSASSSSRCSTLLPSLLTHRVVALSMIQRRIFPAHFHLDQHFAAATMALLRPFINPTPGPTRNDTARFIPTTVIPSQASRRLTLPERIPRGAWDSHMHVVDPAAYPLAKDARYRPKTHRLDHALAFESSVGIDNIVLVQPSIYGTDNACLLDALRALGPRRGRAVVAFEPGSLSPRTLCAWHKLGVRGVRINLSSVGKSLDAQQLESLLQAYARDCKPWDWVIQVYMPMSMMDLLAPIVPTLGVRVCIDHLGHPCVRDMPLHSNNNPYDMTGFRSLARLLEAGNTYVKLSAPYRLSSRADHSDLEPIAREILHLGGRDRVVFATDWPHTRFEGLDIRPWMETVLDWCGKDDVLVERLFRGNAQDLWNTRHSR